MNVDSDKKRGRIINRELQQTTTTMAKRTPPNKRFTVHVRYKSLYISLPFSAKQQREMTKFCVAY